MGKCELGDHGTVVGIRQFGLFFLNWWSEIKKKKIPVSALKWPMCVCTFHSVLHLNKERLPYSIHNICCNLNKKNVIIDKTELLYNSSKEKKD